MIDQNDQPTTTRTENGLTEEDLKVRDWNDALVVARENTFKFNINEKLTCEFAKHLAAERRLQKKEDNL